MLSSISIIYTQHELNIVGFAFRFRISHHSDSVEIFLY